MKSYVDLNQEERDRAIEKATVRLLEAVVEGAVRFDDESNRNTLQADIDAAVKEAEQMRTPWFAGEYIYEAVGDTLRSMGQSEAEDAFYPGPGESVIRL